MNFPLFIAKRLFKEQSDRKKVSRPAIRIAMAGVAIGLAVMIVSVCVVLGFKHSIRNKVIGFGSQIQVADFMTLQTSESYPIQMGDSMMRLLKKVPGVRHVQRFAMKQGILKTESDFLGVVFKGVSEEYDTTFIHHNLVSGSLPKFSASKSSNQLLISKIMADKLMLKTGQKIFAYFIDMNAGIKMRRFTISGIYETNLAQYDQSICFTDLYTAVKLNGWESDQASGAELMVNDFDQIDLSEDYIVKHVNRTVDKYGETYSSKTIQELSPQIFSWLDLLDLNVWIIMALMIAVAGVTMISGLLIIILERTAMIGVLKALGSSNRIIRHTFLWFAFFIIGKGLMIGNLIGFGLVLTQKVFGIIKLDPSIYYINVVPVEINVTLLVLLNIATLLISVFVLIVPSYLISHIHPSKSMRYE
ncbi:ABC transporter permease [Prevotella sp. A2931]|uniref:ABC transporter permease n=1 Tax=Prevotella illustrans TaxID=2800387 RepID=A0ABS3M2T1_9BACT|nr:MULTISPECIES: ABC transporter permease [Prevotella]MBO1362440.1 ABC transporter permease [Prevotella illustrans]PTL25046.1 ABC transporter permease [Prevotella sp. oral taxon 820]